MKEALIPVVTDLFNEILDTEIIPEQWEEVEIKIMHKKGNKTDINNYRPISLSSSMNKIFMKIIKNRIYQNLDENQGLEQAGFRRDFSTIEHIFTLGLN